MVATFLYGLAVGLLLSPLLPYQAILAGVSMAGGILVMALSSDLLSHRR